MINFIREKEEEKDDNKKDSKVVENKNNYLKLLEVNKEGLSPVFNKETTNYNLVVGMDVNSLEVTARPEAEKAKVEVSGHTALVEGSNTITIVVTAENGAKKLYTINVTKTDNLELADASLKSLSVKNFDLYPTFDPEVLEYTINVDENCENLEIESLANKENAEIQIVGNEDLKPGENIILVNVIAEDKFTMKSYTIKVIKPGEIEETQENKFVNNNTKDGGIGKVVKIAVLVIAILAICFGVIFFLYKKEKGVSKSVENNKATISGVDENDKN